MDNAFLNMNWAGTIDSLEKWIASSYPSHEWQAGGFRVISSLHDHKSSQHYTHTPEFMYLTPPALAWDAVAGGIWHIVSTYTMFWLSYNKSQNEFLHLINGEQSIMGKSYYNLISRLRAHLEDIKKSYFHLKICATKTGEVAQQSRLFAALAKEPFPVPSPHTMTHICNSSPRGSEDIHTHAR